MATYNKLTTIQIPTLDRFYQISTVFEEGLNKDLIPLLERNRQTVQLSINDKVQSALSSTDNAIARFDGTTGDVLQNSGVLIDDSNNITGIASLTSTSLSTTTLYVNHIAEKTTAHTIIFDNNVKISGGNVDAIIGNFTPMAGTFTSVNCDSLYAITEGIAIKGEGRSNGATIGYGVIGQSYPTASADTANCQGLTGLSTNIHAGGINIGVYSEASNGATNYSFYGAAGTFYNAGNMDTAGILSVNHIAEHTGGHLITFDDAILATGNASVWGTLYVDHIGESTASHKVVFNNTVSGGQSIWSSGTYPAVDAIRTDAGTSNQAGSLRVVHSSTNDAVDGFGGAIGFAITDSGVTNSQIGAIICQRDGADNSGAFKIAPRNAGSDNDALILYHTGIADIPDQSRASASTNTARTMNNGAWTTVIFEDEDYDTQSEYNTGTGVFTATKAGYYQCSASTACAATNTFAWGEEWITAISRQGDTSTAGSFFQGNRVTLNSATTNVIASSHVSATVYLAAGETVEVKVFNSSGGNLNLSGTATANWFTVHKLS